MATPDTIAHYLLRSVRRAVREFALIAPGDRIAVGVSGGKDSRTLLDLLARGVQLPGVSDPAPYSIVAVHVDGSAVGLPDMRPILEPWFVECDIPHTIVPLEVDEDEPLPLECFRCSWNRRKTLFRAAEQLGCNKVAFGHHADDAAVTSLLSLLYKGKLETLAPRRTYFRNQFEVIRPLIYLAERDIAAYARACGWDIPAELACSREDEAQRNHIERFLHSFDGREQEQIRANLWRLGGAGVDNKA